jgi:hypothetical protein
VRLRRLQEGDIPLLHRLAASVHWGAGSILGGLTLSPADFSSLLAGMERAMVGEAKASGELAGFIAPYRYSVEARRTFLSILTNVELSSSWIRAEVVWLAAQWLFNTGIDQIFFEIPAFNETYFSQQLARYCEPCGTMQDHWYLMGRWWNVSIHRLTRDSFPTDWYSRAIQRAHRE